uniref:Uncharacterized protein n=1 Tax=Oryza punctata TaxID=4537 RepID=A0A0E0LVH2_ORYPU
MQHESGRSYESSSSSSQSSHRGCEREKGIRGSRSTMSHFQSGSRVNCTMLAVLCGKVGTQRTQLGPVPEAQRPRPSYPFPELISSGRLKVHTLINPSVDQFLEAQRALEPRFIYLQGQQLDNEEEIGSLVWGDADVSDPQIFSSLIRPTFPTIVYLEVPSGEKIAQSLQSKGISYIIYWRGSLSSYAASHFRHSLMSVVQSSCSHAWDAFQVAHASFRLYCVRNNVEERAMLGPHLLGDAPRIYISPHGNEMAEEEDRSEYFPDIKIYGEDVNMKLLICGAHCTMDPSLLTLEDGLNSLLNIEIRWCKLQDIVSAAPPLHVETLLDGVVTICCDITTSSSSHVSLLVSGSAQTCSDDKLLEKHIKKEIIDSRRLVRAVSVSEDDTFSGEPMTSMSVASGASTFEVLMTLPKWAAQALKYLAQETSYKSLAPLGIACVDGTPVSSFDKQDVDRLLFFCTNQDEDEAIGNGLYSRLPRWSASLAKDRVKGSIVSKPGYAPRINISPPENEMTEEEDSSEYFPAINIYDEDVNMKLLICGAPCTLPPLVQWWSDFSGSAMAQIQSSSPARCLQCYVTDKQRKPPGLVPEVKRPRLSYPFPELISSGRLEVHTLINPTVDQFRKAQQAVQPNLMYLQGQQLENEEEIGTLVWGDADFLKYLAQETSYRSLVPLGIACVDGTPVSSFDRQDVDRLLFCTTQDEDEAIGNGLYPHLPRWSVSLGKDKVKGSIVPKPETSYRSLVPLGIACVDGTPISSFNRPDVDRLLFFCTNQDEDEAIGNGLYSHLPRWSTSLGKDRVKGSIVTNSHRDEKREVVGATRSGVGQHNTKREEDADDHAGGNKAC